LVKLCSLPGCYAHFSQGSYVLDVDRGHGYVDMAGFALGVEDRLGVFTQIATPRGLKPRIRDRVLREAVAL
jgi:hypothetical protein